MSIYSDRHLRFEKSTSNSCQSKITFCTAKLPVQHYCCTVFFTTCCTSPWNSMGSPLLVWMGSHFILFLNFWTLWLKWMLSIAIYLFKNEPYFPAPICLHSILIVLISCKMHQNLHQEPLGINVLIVVTPPKQNKTKPTPNALGTDNAWAFKYKEADFLV